jgi:hypothetical protein
MVCVMSALPPKADFAGRDQYVRLGLQARQQFVGHSQPQDSNANIRSRKNPEAGVISQFQQKVSAWSIDSHRVAVNGPPPKDPDDDDDQNEEDEEDEGEERRAGSYQRTG